MKCDKLSDCNDPDVGCLLGSEDFHRCIYKKNDPEKAVKDNEPPINNRKEETNFPWSGNTFGETDLKIITNQHSVKVIGLIGPSNSGKTTALIALYLLLRSGKTINGYSFSGTYTLRGWENLASFMTLKKDNKIGWPPHTSSNEGRVPGLLHLSLTDQRKIVHQIVFTDAPGEWFSNWALKASDNSSQGARWIDEYSKSFILFADSDAFSNPQTLGNARSTLSSIIERMKNTNNSRSLALVWSKADITVNGNVKTKLNEKINQSFNNSKIFEVSVKPNGNIDLLTNILSVFEWVLKPNIENIDKDINIKIKNPLDFFFIKR